MLIPEFVFFQEKAFCSQHYIERAERMPRNGTKATPKDLLTELARRKDGVTRVRAYISGIAGACPQHASLDFAHASRGGGGMRAATTPRPEHARARSGWRRG
jgi:hypothetical protein